MKLDTRSTVMVSLMVALTTAGAYLRVPIGPVPITLQTFFVLLSGAVLGPALGATAMVVYLVLGLAGLPVFAAGGGPQYVFSPTFGFLASFPLATAVAGIFLLPKGRVPGFARSFSALLLGTAAVYLIGIPYLGCYLNVVQKKDITLNALLMMGMVPFLPGDLLKILLGTWITPPLRRAVNQVSGR